MGRRLKHHTRRYGLLDRTVARRCTDLLLRWVAMIFMTVLLRDVALTVLLRGVAVRFVTVFLRDVSLIVLLRGVPMRFMTVLLRRVALAVLWRGDTRVVNAQSEHLFYKRASVQKQPSQVRGNTWFRTRVWVRREKGIGRLNKTRK
jgi:hypothetical protein